MFGPLTDFLCLGGGSIIVCGALALLLPQGIPEVQNAALATLLVTAINQPHFAHSYQMFYANFKEKAFGAAYPPSLRLRYVTAGLVVPAVLTILLSGAIIGGSARLLGYSANLMFFLVGWHYVKQGYGILILDSVQKRLFFSDAAKTMLRVNGYVCWITAWLAANHAVTAAPFAGITFYTLPVPVPVYYAAIAAAVISTLVALGVFLRRWHEARGTLPWNGVLAYIATLYLWIVFVRINPLAIAVVPSFHSLQYNAVVWRYQLNTKRDTRDASLSFFILTGVVLGVLGFVGLPKILGLVLPYDKAVLGPSVYLFACVIFINVHHYFLDSVMWRRGNPDIQKYLFGRA